MSALLEIAVAAGEAILVHYGKKIPVDKKADDSPLTIADRAAHGVIFEALSAEFPEIPILSEEGEIPDFEIRKNWSRFFLVDPLDGTKEFIKQTGEFTVNIGLVEDGIPTVGVVYAPATGLTYAAEPGRAGKIVLKKMEDGNTGALGAFGAACAERSPEGDMSGSEGGKWPRKSKPLAAGRQHPAIAELLTPISCGIFAEGANPTIVASRDHAGPEVQKLVDRYPSAEFRSMGSSLKFSLVAEGAADIYLRDVPTMEWDTAAAHAIVNAAGGEIRCLDGSPLLYNKEILKNPAIVTLRPGASALRGSTRVTSEE